MSAQHGAFHVGQIEPEPHICPRLKELLLHGPALKDLRPSVLAGHRIYTARSNGNQRQEPKKGCSTLSDRTGAF